MQPPLTNGLEFYFHRAMPVVALPSMRANLATVWLDVYAKGFTGCVTGAPDSPGWAQSIALRARDQFRAQCRNASWRIDDIVPSQYAGVGAGKRFCGWNYYLQLDKSLGQGRALRGSQDYGNCTSWMTREMVGTCLGIDVVHKAEPHRYTARPGTALVYGSRGWSSQGMALGTAMDAVHNIGIQLEAVYCGGKYDLRDENTDESYGNKWGGSGPPSCLKEEVSGDRMDYVGQVTGGLEAVKDLLYAGYAIGTGCTLTGKGPANPVCQGLQSIGGHAQACLGYDDTDECRSYLESLGRNIGDDCVMFMDQSWGPNWLQVSNWNAALWGEPSEGMWPITGKDFMKIYNQWGDVWAINNVLGFPLRDLPDWGSNLYL